MLRSLNNDYAKITATAVLLSGEDNLTATIGELFKDIRLKLNTPSSIRTNTDGKILIREAFYTVSVIRLLKEQMEHGKVYLVVRS